MEWVETTVVTKQSKVALDQLGVADDDAEFEVIEEPKQGLFGRTRIEAQYALDPPKTPRQDRTPGNGNQEFPTSAPPPSCR